MLKARVKCSIEWPEALGYWIYTKIESEHTKVASDFQILQSGHFYTTTKADGKVLADISDVARGKIFQNSAHFNTR